MQLKWDGFPAQTTFQGEVGYDHPGLRNAFPVFFLGCMYITLHDKLAIRLFEHSFMNACGILLPLSNMNL